MVSQEHHKDGTLHLHAAVWLKKRVNFSSEKYWDFVGGKHGNYKLMHYPQGWVEYILKENDFVSSEGFDPKAFIKAKRKKQCTASVQIADAIVGGEYDIEKLEEFGRGYVMRNLRSIQYYISHVEHRVAAQRINISLAGVEPDDCFNQSETDIFEWLKYYSIRKTLNNGCSGDLHLRIQGPSEIGKTRLMVVLKLFYFRVYEVPFDKDWFDMFNDRDYDLIVFDEYGKGRTMKPQMLNGLVDGMGMSFNRRNREPVVHSKKIPTLMISNFSWDGCYPNLSTDSPEYLKPSKRRFKEVVIPLGQEIIPGLQVPQQTLERLVAHLYKVAGSTEGGVLEETPSRKRSRSEDVE